MKLYLANKMNGIPEYNFPWFDRNRDYLQYLGHEVVSPADIDRQEGFTTDLDFTENDWYAALRRDFSVISLECDGIAFGPDWANSRGARAERAVGTLLGMPFYRVDAEYNVFYREMIIGLAGYAQSGKDTVASILVNDHHFHRIAFADIMKEMLYRLDPVIGMKSDDSFHRVSDLVSAYGWEKAKESKEVRSLLQRLGTEAGRELFGEDHWVNICFEQNLSANGWLVVSDVRFPNEADAIRNRGGKVYRVRRPGYGPVNFHASETSLDDYEFDGYIENSGAIFPDLAEQVSTILREQHVDATV